MKRYLGISFAAFCSLLLVAGLAFAKPAQVRHEVTPEFLGEVDMVGDVDGTNPLPAKALQDTVWIADWSFDSGSGCASVAGWTKIDNRILNDGSNYWHIGADFSGTGGILNNAAILSTHNLCWEVTDGYGNNWDYAIILKYKGTGATLGFNFLSDSEAGYDFFTVEADSAGASEALVNYNIDPTSTSAGVFRDELYSTSGVNNVRVTGLALPDYGLPAVTHEAYIRLVSDGGYSDEDGLYPSAWGAGAIVDSIVVTGDIAYTEEFEGALNANVTLVNSSLALPFGEWARIFQHITDNDKCTENTTCAWLWTDPLKIATFANMAFGPGSAVIHSWLDDIIVSPWASLASTPSATGTALVWRRFAGNPFSTGVICQNWSVRGKSRKDNTDTSTLGDSVDCVSTWGHASNWNSLTSFIWGTNTWDMTAYIDPASTDLQLRLRVADWQYIAGAGAPVTYNVGPGPYNDRIRIGRRVLSGPVWNVGIDTRTQAQDCFPTMLNGIVPGEHFSPETNTSAPLYPYLFGTCAFSIGTELTINAGGPNIVTGDSIYAKVVDGRGVGGVTAVKWYGAIVAGPHAGKSPVAPYTVGANGFFEVTADSARNTSGVWIQDFWNVDLNDYYFRGGDKLVYYWQATDNAAGKGSLPGGISGTPTSVANAEQLTQGLYEVSFLPTINWDPAYLARIAADANGGALAPTATEVGNSSQKNCILYYQHVNSARGSGEINRTSFMYALDRLGYRGYYDVYDVQGYGNTNNQVGGRATVAQANGYALIVEDDGRSNLTVNIPDGSDLDAQKVNQALWYQNYLAGGLTGRAGTATLWVIGENTAYEKSTNALFTTYAGLATIANDQGLAVAPDVSGIASATTWDGCTMSFAGDLFSLAGGCPAVRAYDAATATGTAVITHKYKAGATVGNGAIIMNKNAGLKWNTVWQGFGWFDIRNAAGTPSNPDPAIKLLQKVLNCVLPLNCRQSPNVTDVGDDVTDALPRVSALHQNVPNPFNPTTTIKFDLAREGRVKLQVFDVAGHLVKTLVNGSMAAGRDIPVTWNGLTEAGNRVPSGVYFYQLVTDDLTATKKMVMMK